MIAAALQLSERKGVRSMVSDKLEQEPDDNKVYKTLLESTKAIPW